MSVFKIKNLFSGNYLDSQTEKWSDLKSVPTKQVVVVKADNSLSQRWCIDRISGDSNIRTCLDANFGITRFENAVTHQCGITNICYYANMTNKPFDPTIVLDRDSSRYFRIRLKNSNMYLTELSSPVEGHFASWGAYSDSGELKNRQLWLLETTTDFTCTTKIMPQNMNQKYSEYSNAYNSSGCFCSSVGDVAAFYRGKPYTYDDMIEDGIFSKNDVRCNYGKVPYCKFTVRKNSFLSYIKNGIDENSPLVATVSYTYSNGDIGKHRVAIYGYKGNCTSYEDVLVLDPVGENTSVDMGRYSTFQDVIDEYNEIRSNAEMYEVYTTVAKE